MIVATPVGGRKRRTVPFTVRLNAGSATLKTPLNQPRAVENLSQTAKNRGEPQPATKQGRTTTSHKTGANLSQPVTNRGESFTTSHETGWKPSQPATKQGRTTTSHETGANPSQPATNRGLFKFDQESFRSGQVSHSTDGSSEKGEGRGVDIVLFMVPFIGSGQNHLARHSERGKKTRQTEEEVRRQHQGMVDRPGVRQVPESSGEQGKWRKLVAKSSVVPQRPSWLRDKC